MNSFNAVDLVLAKAENFSEVQAQNTRPSLLPGWLRHGRT